MKIIGIVGGVGPKAGVDLHSKIIHLTQASKDQEHLPVVHISFSSRITDRSEYLLSPAKHPNPAEAINQVIDCLYKSGARVIGIPCNTCHSPSILSVIRQHIKCGFPEGELQLLDMIEEVCRAATEHKLQKIGLLATQGTYNSRLYYDIFREHGLEILHPASEQQQRNVHSAIYDPERGIKANVTQADNKFAREILLTEAQHLLDRGVEAIILGCTEIPLVLCQSDFPALDATEILARSLIERAIAPEPVA